VAGRAEARRENSRELSVVAHVSWRREHLQLIGCIDLASMKLSRLIPIQIGLPICLAYFSWVTIAVMMRSTLLQKTIF
jgi:hypothetical protein